MAVNEWDWGSIDTGAPTESDSIYGYNPTDDASFDTAWDTQQTGLYSGGGGPGGGSSFNLGDLLGGLGFTSGGMQGFGNMMTGFGGLAEGWGALKDAKLAREALAQQQVQWEQNYESQRLVTNNAIANQNAWKKAQGRTDFGSYVGGKPAGSNYV